MNTKIMKQRKYFCVYYLHLLFVILCYIPINESYYNNNNSNGVQENNKNNKNDYDKFPTIKTENQERQSKSLWHDPEQQTYFDSYAMSPYQYQYRQPNSGKSSPYRFPDDLLGQETNPMDVSNSVWNSNEFGSKTNGDWKKTNKAGETKDFEKNVHGLVDDWIYSSDYDQYDYPNEDYYSYSDDMNDQKENEFAFPASQYNNKPPATYHSLSYQKPSSRVKVNRRSDHINDGGYDTLKHEPASTSQRYRTQSQNHQDKIRNTKGYELGDIKGKKKFRSKNVEEKHIIAGIDINPLTSNALMGFTSPSISSSFGGGLNHFKDLYKSTSIFSDLRGKSKKMKNSFDNAILDVGDGTLGRKNKDTFQTDVGNFVTGFRDTMNEIDDNSINTKFRNKLKSTMKLRNFKDAKEINSPNTQGNSADYRNRYRKEGQGMKQKLPKMIQRVKNNLKGMGFYVLKKTKQILVEPSSKTSSLHLPTALSPSQLILSKGDQTDRQGLSLFGTLLASYISAPMMSWITVLSFAAVEVFSMAVQSALQINQSNPTSAPAEPTASTTKAPCSLITCTGNSNTCDAGTCLCGSAAECGTPLTNICTLSTCKCGTAVACTSGSTLATCLSSAAATPTSSDTAATCKCSGTGASDTCYGSGNSGYVATTPLCGDGTTGTIGVCIKCVGSAGVAGDGDGTTQGSCVSALHKCCADGTCVASC